MSRETLLVEGEPIQWHRNNTSHDKCPNCCGGMGYLKVSKRCCMTGEREECKGFVRTLEVTPSAWLRLIGFSPDEIERLMSKGPHTRGQRHVRYVRPGFLGRVEIS